MEGKAEGVWSRHYSKKQGESLLAPCDHENNPNWKEHFWLEPCGHETIPNWKANAGRQPVLEKPHKA